MLRLLVIFRVLSPQVVCNLCGPGCHDEGVHCILYVCWGGAVLCVCSESCVCMASVQEAEVGCMEQFLSPCLDEGPDEHHCKALMLW